MIYETSTLAIVVFVLFVIVTVGLSFYLGRKVRSSEGYFAAHGQIPWAVNGVAFAGDYLSAASFLGICGMIAFYGYDGFLYSIGFLAGWIVLQETHDPLSYLFIALVVAGVVLAILNKRISVEDKRVVSTGVLLGFALALLQTISQLLSKKALLGGVSPLSANTVRVTCACVGLFLFSGLAGRWIRVRIRDFRKQEWLYIVGAALVGSFPDDKAASETGSGNTRSTHLGL